MTGNKWAAPREWKYYIEKDGILEVPRGMRGRLVAFFDKVGAEVEYSSELRGTALYPVIPDNNLALRDYQKPLVEKMLKYQEGILWAGTGTGKTIMALEVIYRLGLRATILVNKTALAYQFQSELKKYYDYDAGMVGNGKKDIKGITIATVQTLQRDPDLLEKLAARTAVLVMDECQSAVTNKTMGVLRSFAPKHLYGLSATPFRDDGKTLAIGFFFGAIIAKYKSEEMKPVIQVIKTGAKIPVDDYHVMIENMVNHEDRNELIKLLVMGEILDGRKVLVLTKRVQHYKNIQENFFDSDEIFFIDSADKDRNLLLSRLKSGEQPFQVIFGTTSLLSVGIDIPSLDTLILVCDMKGTVITTQSIGRIQRLFKGKENPKVIDLWDDKNPILTRQFWARWRIYSNSGFEIQMSV